MCSKSWLERKDEMLQTEKKHYEEYRGCNEYHTEHIVAGPNSNFGIILIWSRFLSELFLEGSFLMNSRFLSLSNRANEGIWSSSDIHRIVKALMRVNGYHNRRVSHNEFEWKSTIDERIPQARGSSEIRQYWEGCNATEALFTSQLNYFLRLI